mmetsp:Transcript_60126/g.127376  ORF Transcript_60126/g.127376 Transcript_60126/m.127376 type:complete len:109 (-) Transcript_60126:201-527(-)
MRKTSMLTEDEEEYDVNASSCSSGRDNSKATAPFEMLGKQRKGSCYWDGSLPTHSMLSIFCPARPPRPVRTTTVRTSGKDRRRLFERTAARRHSRAEEAMEERCGRGC